MTTTYAHCAVHDEWTHWCLPCNKAASTALSEERLDYVNEHACHACLHDVRLHHPDNLFVGCTADCGCSRTQITAR